MFKHLAWQQLDREIKNKNGTTTGGEKEAEDELVQVQGAVQQYIGSDTTQELKEYKVKTF